MIPITDTENITFNRKISYLIENRLTTHPQHKIPDIKAIATWTNKTNHW